MHNPAPVLENDSHKLLWDFKHTNGSPNPGQKTRLHNNQQQKKKNLQNCRLGCPGGPPNKSEGK